MLFVAPWVLDAIADYIVGTVPSTASGAWPLLLTGIALVCATAAALGPTPYAIAGTLLLSVSLRPALKWRQDVLTAARTGAPDAAPRGADE